MVLQTADFGPLAHRSKLGWLDQWYQRPGVVPAVVSVDVIVLVISMRFSFIVLVLVSLCTVPGVRADWINLTGAETAPNIAEIYILDDHVKLVLAVYIDDLQTFEELIPDDWLKDSTGQRPALAERLRIFSSKTFQFITETGEKLPTQLQLVEPRIRTDRKSPFAGMINPMTRQRVPEAPADKRVLYAELVYPFKEKLKALTIVPPLDDEGRALVTIGFIAYHKAVPIIDFRYLGAPARVALNWQDPWYTTFDNPNLTRHHKTALMSFLYVEPYEVRHEILTRVKDLEQRYVSMAKRANPFSIGPTTSPLLLDEGDRGQAPGLSVVPPDVCLQR
jgi:hypothetical protein